MSLPNFIQSTKMVDLYKVFLQLNPVKFSHSAKMLVFLFIQKGAAVSPTTELNQAAPHLLQICAQVHRRNAVGPEDSAPDHKSTFEPAGWAGTFRRNGCGWCMGPSNLWVLKLKKANLTHSWNKRLNHSDERSTLSAKIDSNFRFRFFPELFQGPHLSNARNFLIWNH